MMGVSLSLARRWRAWGQLLGAATLVGVLLLPGAATARAATGVVGPKAYYLTLGDSLAFGYQPNLDWTHGYAAAFYADLRTRGTSHAANLACLDETTATFINSGCPYAYLRKTLYAGSQLKAALSVIAAHPNQVSPVTLDIGANDLLPLLNTSTCAVSSNSAATLATFNANFTAILSQLSAALKGTGDLLVMNYYNPYQNQCASNPQVASLFATFDGDIANDVAACAYGGGLPCNGHLADVAAAFGGDTTPNPNLCADTWICSPYHDIHATTPGYGVIASAFESAAGY
jgi:lysophospholipase L1-like esterase